jgi:poly-beta-1,6-N-acetyl-D-glucosamine synthase
VSNYVLITPVHNEEAFIQKVIAGVVAQTCKPAKWIIVDDGSTDETGAIVRASAAGHDFIQLVTLRSSGQRSFSRKADAFNFGVSQLTGISYDFIGNLDADIFLEPHYFENMRRLLQEDPQLGIVGGVVFTTVRGQYVTQDENPESVAGAVQLFRKACFADVGGSYLRLPFGGIDAAAEFIAKQKGWKVRKSFQDIVREGRQTGTATVKPLSASYRLGRRFHSLGYGFFFYSLRCVFRMRDDPLILGSFASFFGFLESLIRRRPVLLPQDVVQFLRAEHRKKLLQLCLPFHGGRKASH